MAPLKESVLYGSVLGQNTKQESESLGINKSAQKKINKCKCGEAERVLGWSECSLPETENTHNA